MLENLDNAEILRYLGSVKAEADERLIADIERVKRQLEGHVNPRYVSGKFLLERIDGGIAVVSTNLVLAGNDIKRLLEHSDECILMAATLGLEADKMILSTQKTSISDGVIMDAAASAAIEAFCDGIQNELSDKYNLTRRYSCGYGDFPLETQPKILAVLNAQKTIGLSCNRNNIMLPRKSVTAIMGVTNAGQETDWCESCRLSQDCDLRRAGEKCGRQGVY